MKLSTTLNFPNEIYNLDFIKEYYPEVKDISRIENLELTSYNILCFTYNGADYELPVVNKSEFLKTVKYLGLIDYTDNDLNMFFRTKSGNFLKIPLEDFGFIIGENVEKVKKLIDNN